MSREVYIDRSEQIAAQRMEEFRKFGIKLVRGGGCMGAFTLHATEAAKLLRILKKIKRGVR